MLNVFWLLVSIFLIFLIFLRTPQNNGLVNFTIKNNLLGSPNSTERFLNNLTLVLISLYLLIAIKSNFNNVSF